MEFIFGVVVLLLDIWAIVNIISSPTSTLSKVLWTIGIIVLPIIGFLAWFLFGPKSGSRSLA
ncbi:PLD nuclease N-terminal domain-containing protein [Aurantiacibacter suaedae]|uniref:PLD nuclease N-terminal domain-containing protein n=1 Tax=Aurantiacibacter suaedae TaxID=2545755 RepID=UPI0010F62B46|nr:PLD nuclease N-terminal domain-containing protein [Aurantiacibacter suaedae]